MLNPRLNRPLLRTGAILPLLLCLAAWILSTSHGHYLTYSRAGTTYAVGSAWGTFALATTPSTNGWWDQPPTSSGFNLGHYTMTASHFWPIDLGPRALLGFRYLPTSTPTGHALDINIPYWFLTLLLLPVSICLWRKAAPLPRRSGFAVQPAPPAQPHT